MKMNLSKILVGLMMVSSSAFAAGDVLEDFDKLGGNDALLEKAKALQPETSVTVVQDRLVKRNARFELMPEYAAVLGGDPYINTRGYGLNMQFHFTPFISLGAKYNSYGNDLTSEGENLIKGSKSATVKFIVPDIDYPIDQTLAILNVYPFYGKLNVFNKIAHFDIYGLLGYGTTTLASGAKNTVTGGAGVGFWIANHFTARWELRYQNYKALKKPVDDVDVNLTISSLQLGYLF